MSEVERHRFQAEENLYEAMRYVVSTDGTAVVLALGALTHAVLALTAQNGEGV